MMNSVRRGSSPRSTGAMSWPSTLETKCSAQAARARRRRAPAPPSAARGREPPMPMLTTSADAAARRRARSRRRPACASSTSCTSALNGPLRRCGARSAVCSTARPSVVLIGSPREHRVAPRFDAALARQLEQEAARRDVPIRFFDRSAKTSGASSAERVEARRVAREGVAQVEVAAVRLEVAAQRGPGRRAVAARIGVHCVEAAFDHAGRA